jgi:acetylornithine aminotransferase
LLTQALAKGLLISIQAGRVIRLLPPLILSADEAAQLADQVVNLINAFSDQQAA